jgi:transketolase
LLGGAADLAPSTKTELKDAKYGHFQSPALPENPERSYRGRNLHFGLREHAMCAIVSGMNLSKLRPYAASFLVFTDYCRAALRLSAMMEIPVIYIWTHDSISLGEDGPTHQPVAHLASLRAMPGMIVLRPADANEVVEAWRVIMRQTDRPVCLILTRQAVPTLDRSKYASESGVARGAYILADAPHGKPDVLLLSTGSEVSLCVTAYEQLQSEGINARVISMPSWELFEHQSQEYRDSVLPPDILARVAVEEASIFGWERYAGNSGTILGMRCFGLSAPGAIVADHFGFTPERVVAAAKEQIARHAAR